VSAAFKVTIGKFGDDDSADIYVDGKNVGWLERVHGERFKSATSYARVQYVSHYSIMLTDDAADAQLRKHDVDSRGEAKKEIAAAFERAWEELAKRGPAAPPTSHARSAVPGYSNYGGGGPFAPMGAPVPATRRTRRSR
jgi:hypothetical protein